MTSTYHFVTRWRVKADVREVFDIISQPLEYPRWWPSVYLDAREIGKHRVRFHTKGLLPYTLQWESTHAEAVPPNRLVVEAAGDFNGRGIWSLAQDGEFVDITFDWDLAIGKALLKYLTPMLRPVFEANHRWAMEQGETALREELIRYRARTPEELLEAGEPRGPVEVPVRWIAVSAAVISAIACVALVRRKSRKVSAAA
jgi:hypothetical protein